VTEAAGLFLGQHDHLDGLLGKPLKHGPGPGARGTNLSGLKAGVGRWRHLFPKCPGEAAFDPFG